MNRMPENCCTTASTKHERPGGRAGHGRRIGLGLLMVLPSLPGGFIVLRALTLPRNSPGLPDLCPLHRTTGLWCPLCGGTRATRELMHGDLWAAMGYNPFALVLEVVVMVLVARWLLAWLRGRASFSGWRWPFSRWCATCQACGSTSALCSALRAERHPACIMRL